MAETSVYLDEHQVLEVRFAEGAVDWVTLKANWRDHYQPHELCAELSRLIRESLPPVELPSPPDFSASVARDWSLDQAAVFWRQFDMVQDLLSERLERLANRPDPAPEEPYLDRAGRVGVWFSSGRFDRLEADSEWMGSAPRQTICESFTEALRARPLVKAPTPDPQSEEIERRISDLTAILSGN